MNNTSTAYGATMLIKIGDSELNDNFAVTPYFRVYFLESEDYGGYGFFAEVFSKFVFCDSLLEEVAPGGFVSDNENYFDIALVAALCRKWINNKGYSFEVRLGLGRNLLYENNQIDRTEVMASFYLTIFIKKFFFLNMNLLRLFLFLVFTQVFSQDIRINEVVASNSIIYDEDGDTPDLILQETECIKK